MDYDSFHESNHDFINDFMNHGSDEISNILKATIAQFLAGVKKTLHTKADKMDYVSDLDILNTQIEVLSTCILDLNTCINKIMEGVTIQ